MTVRPRTWHFLRRLAVALAVTAPLTLSTTRANAEETSTPDSSTDEAGAATEVSETAPAATARKHLPTTEVNMFHESGIRALEVSDRLTVDEVARVRDLTHAGEEIVALIKGVNGTDHRAMTEHVARLGEVRVQLEALHQLGLTDRSVGTPLVLAHHMSHGWTDIGLASDGLEALRVRFVKPGSAHVSVRNATEADKPVLIEMEFFDGLGAKTGEALFESEDLEDLRPGEVRELLVQIYRLHPRFWDVTKGYTITFE